MTNVNWAVAEQLSVTQVLPSTVVGDATPVESTPLDLRTLPVGSRIAVCLNAFETVATNTGGVWSVTESATSGGSYTAATLDGSLVATPAAAGNDLQTVSVRPNPTKPFLKVTFTGADASTDVDVSATVVAVNR